MLDIIRSRPNRVPQDIARREAELVKLFVQAVATSRVQRNSV
jgi:hypothetical protein